MEFLEEYIFGYWKWFQRDISPFRYSASEKENDHIYSWQIFPNLCKIHDPCKQKGALTVLKKIVPIITTPNDWRATEDFVLITMQKPLYSKLTCSSWWILWKQLFPFLQQDLFHVIDKILILLHTQENSFVITDIDQTAILNIFNQLFFNLPPKN